MSETKFVVVVLCNDINGQFWTRTRLLTGQETIAEVMDWWCQISTSWAKGDLRIVAAEEANRSE